MNCEIVSSVQFACVQVIGDWWVMFDWCFVNCGSIISISFASDSRVLPLNEWVFSRRGLTGIHLPASVDCWFGSCRSLSSISFAAGSRLSRIKDWTFHVTSLTAIHLPSSLEVRIILDFDRLQLIAGRNNQNQTFQDEFPWHGDMVSLASTDDGLWID
jgi:hypothetical protein